MTRHLSRRRFLAGSALLGGGAATVLLGTAGAAPPSERVRLAAIGVGGRASTLIRGFSSRGDVEFPALADVNPGRDTLLDTLRHLEERQGSRPRSEKDYRRVLDDPSIDGVIVGTPDHWHAPMTILACQAGKDVYVEKPPSHNLWEGRKMVEAARRHGRVVQVGTQNRSAPYVQEAVKLVREGGIGKVCLVRVHNLKSGGPFQKGSPAEPPAAMDYDTWLGPAPARPYNATTVFGGWHQYWDFSGGDMADDGVHQLDIARWLIDRDFPRAIHAAGGNLAFEDDRETPDTQTVTYEYDGLVMTFHLTQFAPYMRKTPGHIREGDLFPLWLENSTRIELYGTRRLMVLGRHGGGWQVFSGDGKVDKEMFGRIPEAPHQENFVACIKSRARPNADAEEGHRSAALVHLGNIAYRLKRRLEFDARTETFPGDAEANRHLRREYRKGFEVPDAV